MRKLIYQELIEKRKTEEEAKSQLKFPIVLIIENIRSNYNVGSIFRTADSANIEAIYICGYSPTPYKTEVEKTALGATKTVPWKYFNSIEEPINELKSRGYSIAALEICDKSIDYRKVKIDCYPLALILGNEIIGVSDDALSICDFAIEIPMYGLKHSLNVSVATGIAIYELINILQS
jgi:tRNA G18 (ribose-2'-O)-methylase SpoU